MTAYYNEIDPYAAEWLRTLILVGLIAPGEVDERSIEDVTPGDLAGYTQCHFFAGIGGWAYALQLAGWPDDRPVWTGSCPCQPFSAAGKGRGHADERHLWPAWHHLIAQCRPPVIFGEQVEAAIKHAWLDLVQADLEGIGYACGTICLPAASVGAPHGRSRLWFVADAAYQQQHRGRNSGQGGRVEHSDSGGTCSVADDDSTGRRQQRSGGLLNGQRSTQRDDVDGCGTDGELGHTDDERPQGRRLGGGGADQCAVGEAGVAGRMADSERSVGDGRADEPIGSAQGRAADRRSSAWSECDWLPCIDGKARPTQPGLFPLAHGVPARVGRLRAYGNAIVPQVAAEVIKAYMG